MLAVHTSNVEPLTYQIAAVYESMLPRQPLRFVLADDLGAGKTIIARHYIRELIMRADAHRVLIVAPGSVVYQWREELFVKLAIADELIAHQASDTFTEVRITLEIHADFPQGASTELQHKISDNASRIKLQLNERE